MDITVFEKGLVNWKIELSSKQMEQFLLYYEKMVEKNKVMNLTAITGFEEVVYKHFLDSLSIIQASIFLGKEKCGLNNIETVHSRAEDAGRKPEYREKFDFCVSRAVAHLSILAEYGLPFVKQGGYFIPYKSGNIEEEIKESEYAIKTLSGKIEEKISFSIPNTDMERTLVLVKKAAPIQKKYPRKAGTPQKEPLI